MLQSRHAVDAAAATAGMFHSQSLQVHEHDAPAAAAMSDGFFCCSPPRPEARPDEADTEAEGIRGLGSR